MVCNEKYLLLSALNDNVYFFPGQLSVIGTCSCARTFNSPLDCILYKLANL